MAGQTAADEAPRRLVIGLAGLLVLMLGTIGYVGFGLSLLDAVFQTVITVSTVGFGEAWPFGWARRCSRSCFLVGCATADYTFGVPIDTLVEGYRGATLRNVIIPSVAPRWRQSPESANVFSGLPNPTVRGNRGYRR